MALDTKELMIRSLSEEMSNFDTTVDTTGMIRNKVISKLDSFVDQITEMDTSDPDKTMTGLSIINTTLRALSDQEAAATRRITAKLRHQESKRADNTSEQVSLLLRNMSLGNTGTLPDIDLDGVSLNLERAFRETGDFIDETELRSDPNDLS